MVKLAQDVLFISKPIYEAIVDKLIYKEVPKELQPKYKEVLFRTKSVFKNKADFVAWFFEKTIDYKDGGRCLSRANEYLDAFEQLYSHGYDGLTNYSVVKFDSVEEALKKLKEVESGWLEQESRTLTSNQIEDESSDILMEVDNRFSWFLVGCNKSNLDSASLGHCGHDPKASNILSLREKRFDSSGNFKGWIVRMSLGYTPDTKTVSQAKGWKNNKPSSRYFKYFIELVKNKFVDIINLEGSYAPHNDLFWCDFSKTDLDLMKNSNPKVMKDPVFKAIYEGNPNDTVLASNGIKYGLDEKGELAYYWVDMPVMSRDSNELLKILVPQEQRIDFVFRIQFKFGMCDLIECPLYPITNSDPFAFPPEQGNPILLIGNEKEPTLITPNGDKFWMLDGLRHRDGGPAIESNKGLSWLKEDKTHREDGPALILYNEVGVIIKEAWYINDVLHREDGPAVILYNDRGRKLSEEYWINGNKVEN